MIAKIKANVDTAKLAKAAMQAGGVWVRSYLSMDSNYSDNVDAILGSESDKMSSDYSFIPLSELELSSPEAIGIAIAAKLGIT